MFRVIKEDSVVSYHDDCHFYGTTENENPNHPIQKPVNPRSKTKTKNPTLSKVIRHPSL